MKMKTLYITDLDGTLLRSDESISCFTAEIIQKLVSRGICFSFATARSLVTTKKVTSALNTGLPAVVYNGAFIMDSQSGEILLSNYFDDSIISILSDLEKAGVFPLVYSFDKGKEKVSFVSGKSSAGQKLYLESRKGDKRLNSVSTFEELYIGDKFYITCIDDEEKLLPIYEKYKSAVRCLYQKDYYSEYFWLEIMPKDATKAKSAQKLKELLGCDKIVAFGDEINDIELFQIADEAYAVSNANPLLLPYATGTIGSNDSDGVANWLCENLLK